DKSFLLAFNSAWCFLIGDLNWFLIAVFLEYGVFHCCIACLVLFVHYAVSKVAFRFNFLWLKI
ncbi:hypothetical protein, partial [Photobacterium sanctipauli]|uniref:hypothetical protein n=1 Tax=Photobacterium sanctipauli TaxID=1342794 RepID=UPI001C1E768A